MKVSTFAFVTILTLTSVGIATANARDTCAGHACKGYPRTAFDIALQYANGGQFGGVTSGTTGTMLDVALNSMNFSGAPQLYASPWRVPPAVAKGE